MDSGDVPLGARTDLALSRPSPLAHAGAAALMTLAALIAYSLTAYRTVPGGDSGELIGAVASGGVIHPPGYPLYALLGALFVHLPLGSIALRLNLLSSVCGAAAAGLLTYATSRATRSLEAGIVAGGLFAFAPSIWRYAIAAEVFALNNLIIALLITLAVLYDETRERRFALAGAFTLGLGLSNHHTVLFTGIPVIVWALVIGRRDLLRPRALVLLVLAGAAGLLPYFYLPIAASHHAFVSWGAADTWSGFLTHVLRREYGTFRLAPAGVGAEVQAKDVLDAWWAHTTMQLPPWGLLLVVVGVVVLVRAGMRQRHGLAIALLIPPCIAVGVMMALGNLPIATALFREILARFWQQPDLYLALFAGVGMAGIVSLSRARADASGLVKLVPLGLALAIAGGQLVAHAEESDHHRDTLVQQYGSEMLRVAPENAILVTKGDLITNTVRYLQLAEHARPDVRVIDQELLATSWGEPLLARHARGVVFPGARLSLDPRAGFNLKQLFDANAGSPITVCGGLLPFDHTTDGSYGLWPAGLCDEVHSGSEPVSLDDWITRSDGAVPRIDFDGHARPDGSWEAIVWSDYWEVRQARAAHILTVVGSNQARRKYIPKAVEILQQVVDEHPEAPAHVWKNLAIAIGRAGITTPQQKAQALRAWQGYLRVAPATDPQLPAIRAEMERLRH